MGRIVEPTSKLDSLRVLEEVGLTPPSYATLKRRLPKKVLLTGGAVFVLLFRCSGGGTG